MANGVNLLEPTVLQGGGGSNVRLTEYIAGAYPMFFSLVVFLAVVMIAWSGLEYMLKETPFGKKEAKNRMWIAIGGLILALAAILILDTINPDIADTTLQNIGAQRTQP